MARVRTVTLGLLVGAGLAVFVGGGWVASRSASSVDWSQARAIVLESDDWGLCGFVPSAAALADIDRRALVDGRFPPVYWGSTLEDSASVAALCAVLAHVRGRDSLPAVFQPNYIIASLSYEPDRSSHAWIRRDLPDLPPQYPRPGLWRAVTKGRNAGVWYPEFHGSFHYDPELRMAAVRDRPAVREAAQRGILVFPGSQRAWELGPWRSEAVLTQELERALAVFETLFDRPPGSVIAPDYTWTGREERLWSRHGLRVIQAKREQRHPDRRDGGWWTRVAKVIARAWDRVRRPELIYLERNCRFEVVQESDPRAAAARGAREVYEAWRRGEPAIVETHRVNFAHVDTAVAAAGRAALATLLETTADRDPGPLFLTDHEIAQLHRHGTAVCRRGTTTVARNLTHGRKVVWIPDARRAGGSVAGPGPDRSGRFYLLGAGATRVIPMVSPVDSVGSAPATQ